MAAARRLALLAEPRRLTVTLVVMEVLAVELRRMARLTVTLTVVGVAVTMGALGVGVDEGEAADLAVAVATAAGAADSAVVVVVVVVLAANLAMQHPVMTVNLVMTVMPANLVGARGECELQHHASRSNDVSEPCANPATLGKISR